MKKYSLIFLLIQFSIFVFAQKTTSEKKALNLLKKYNPEGYYIINTTSNVPNSYKFGSTSITMGKNYGFAMYIRGNTTADIIKSLNTVVHEMTHDYTSRLVYKIMKEKNMKPDGRYIVIFIQGKENILIKETETFPSKELVKQIPKNLRTLRFNTYINTDEKILATQQSGIYGLLDEFSAYYHGTKTSYDLYNYYLQETKKTNQDYLNYMQDFNSTFYAYLEFKYYILKYLIYAQKKHPKIYQDIIANKSFKSAFLKIDKLYTKLIQDYFVRNKKIIETLKNKGISVKIGEEFTMIGNSGIGNFMKEYNLLKSELAKNEYQSMMQVLEK